MATPARSTLRVALGACAVTVAVAACGGGPGPDTTVAKVSRSGADQDTPARKKASDAATVGEQLLAYAHCMRDHGVADYPDPKVTTSGRPHFDEGPGTFDELEDNAHFEKAQSACRSKQPAFAGQFERTVEEQAEQRASLLAFARCMRRQGIEFPNPTFDANGDPQFGDPPDGARHDHLTMQTARDTCHRELGDIADPPSRSPEPAPAQSR